MCMPVIARHTSCPLCLRPRTEAPNAVPGVLPPDLNPHLATGLVKAFDVWGEPCQRCTDGAITRARHAHATGGNPIIAVGLYLGTVAALARAIAPRDPSRKRRKRLKRR